MKTLQSLVKIAQCYMNDHKVSNLDYRDEYNKIVSTYQIWNRRMLPSLTTVFCFDLLLHPGEKIHILDFGCGMGYVTGQIISFFKKNNRHLFSITGVDISDMFITYCRKIYADENAHFIEYDGIEYLKKTPPETFDAIYCSWALPYFNHNVLLPEFYRVCKNEGIVGLVSNCKGTLRKIESSFLEVMLENPDSFKKVMDISSHLPGGRNGLNKWMNGNGFLHISSGEKNVEFIFHSPAQLYAWLNDCGALAGTKQIFNNPESVKEEIVKKIKKKNKVYREGKELFCVNHKFVFGNYRKRVRG